MTHKRNHEKMGNTSDVSAPDVPASTEVKSVDTLPAGKSSKSPAFRFYANDFFQGTFMMSLQEVGAYIRLLCYEWDNGSIPDDPAERARIMGCSKGQEAVLWNRVEKKFTLAADGYINDRLEEERRKQFEYRRRQSDRGIAGATGRWKRKHSQSDGTSNGASIPQAMLADGLSFSSSSSSSKEQEQIPKTPRATRLDERFDVWWSAYPKKTGKAAALKQWTRIRPSDAVFAQMLESLKWQRNQPQWTRDEGKYVPNPATYLHQGRWEDEPFFAAPDTDPDAELMARLEAIERGEAKH